MRRRVVAFLCAGALMAVTASPAWADAGSPGTTFPEQPGANVQTACGTITTNPGTGNNRLVDIVPPNTNAILTGLFTDACFGG
jgi:hypothetical protein